MLIASVIFLICFGLAAIYSVALSGGEAGFFNLQKQIIGSIIGFAVLFVLASIHYKVFKTYSTALYILSVLMLLIVLFFGSTLRGTTGWFVVGGFGFQPVEFAKVFVLIFLAAYFSRLGHKIDRWKEILVSGFAVFILFILVALQPDFGSAVILFTIWAGLLLLRGIKKKYLIILVVLLIASIIAGWFLVLADYQKERVMTFINPELDPLGSGYNVTQAKIAVGSGGILGRGLGFGSQSQLKFLPASQTDFIFAVIAEELGLLGVSFILGFWGIFFWRLIRAARLVRDSFGLFFILGAIILFLSEITVNIGMNLGMMPVTGITLPFVSLGSSSLISSMMVVGIVESVIARN